MVFQVKKSMGIFSSAILTEIYSFSNMIKHNLCKNNIILDSPPRRATWERKSRFFGKIGKQTKKLIWDQHEYEIQLSFR